VVFSTELTVGVNILPERKDYFEKFKVTFGKRGKKVILELD